MGGEKQRYLKLRGHRDPKWRGQVGPNGRGLCRWCGQEVPAGRVTWCSARCIKDYRLRSNGDAVRLAVFKRDLGRCALCHLDTEALKHTLFKHERRLYGLLEPLLGRLAVEHGTFIHMLDAGVRSKADEDPAVKQAADELRQCLAGLPPALVKRWRAGRSLWDADHTVPVVEGGGAAGLDNLRTLCVPCHQTVTKALRQRLEARRWRAKLDRGS